MLIDPILLEIISGIFADLAAGFIGVAVIVPIFSLDSTTFNLTALTVDIFSSILFLLLAYQIKKYSKKRKV